jgi:RNA polymerase sigma-70 factor (ECF subfamily)
VRRCPGHAFPPALSVGSCAWLGNGVSFARRAKLTIRGHWEHAIVTDHAPFRTELVALLPRLRRFALTLTRNPADGDDLLQATCERAMLRMAQWQESTRLDSWLYTMMRNLWTSETRKRRVRLGQGQVDAAVADELLTPVGPADHVYGNELITMMMALPEGLSAALLLVSIEGHSYKEAAEILDIPIGTVMSRMSKARQLVKERLAQTGGRADT